MRSLIIWTCSGLDPSLSPIVDDYLVLLLSLLQSKQENSCFLSVRGPIQWHGADPGNKADNGKAVETNLDSDTLQR